jgi:acyl-CoA thioesterase I
MKSLLSKNPGSLHSSSLLLMLMVVSTGVVRAQKAASEPLRLEGKMVCVGDSITFGEGVAPAQSYVGLLAAKAKAENLDLQVIGQGRSGWSTGSYIQNAKEIAEAMPADATIVTILLGTNDAHEEGSPQEVGERAARNLGKLIEIYHARAPGAQFVVMTPTRALPEILTKRLRDAHYGEKTPVNLKQIDEGLEAVARARGLLFIDLSDVPSSSKNSIDGIHPNAAGHKEIFEAVWRSVSAAATNKAR